MKYLEANKSNIDNEKIEEEAEIEKNSLAEIEKNSLKRSFNDRQTNVNESLEKY